MSPFLLLLISLCAIIIDSSRGDGIYVLTDLTSKLNSGQVTSFTSALCFGDIIVTQSNSSSDTLVIQSNQGQNGLSKLNFRVESSRPGQYTLSMDAGEWVPGYIVRATLSIGSKGRLSSLYNGGSNMYIADSVEFGKWFSLKSSSWGDVLVSDAAGIDNMDIRISGSGSVSVNRKSGEFQTFKSDIDGSGELGATASFNNSVTLGTTGTGNICIQGEGKLDNISANIEGSGDIEFFYSATTGTANDGGGALLSKVSGTGNMNMCSLRVDNVDVVSRGTGNMQVHPLKTFTGTISGTGDVFNFGSVENGDVAMTGTGDVLFGNAGDCEIQCDFPVVTFPENTVETQSTYTCSASTSTPTASPSTGGATSIAAFTLLLSMLAFF